MLIYPGFRGQRIPRHQGDAADVPGCRRRRQACAAICVAYYQELKKAGVGGEFIFMGAAGTGSA